MSEKTSDALTIRGYQDAVDQWINEIGIRYFNELTNTAILMEEVGELARIMAREYGEQSWKKSAAPPNLADEMADVLFVLTCLANQCGVDLTDAIERNLDKKTGRDRQRHAENTKLNDKSHH